jgi:predicted nucleic acid-binding protein
VLLVVADTSPINYLLLIGHIEILPALFKNVILPSEVRDELAKLNAPLSVRNWIANPPAWLDVRETAVVSTMHLLPGSMRANRPQSFSLSNCTPICY